MRPMQKKHAYLVASQAKEVSEWSLIWGHDDSDPVAQTRMRCTGSRSLWAESKLTSHVLLRRRYSTDAVFSLDF